MKNSMIQHIKSLALMVLFVLPMAVAFSSCSSDNDPFVSASENDYPRILNSDLQGSYDDVPPVLKEITRSENFTFEVTVTPSQYTTVTWYIDGVLVHEGTEIDMPLAMGEYLLKIVATTTKGLETSRTRRIIVTANADDPKAGNDIYDRLVKQGTDAKLHGENMAKVTKIIINGQTINVTYNADEDCVEYTVPDLPDGKYTLQLVNAEGIVFDAGEIELNVNPQYGGEQTVWEGEFEVTWGTPFKGLQFDMINLVEPGAVLRLYVSGNGQGCAATAWWRNLETGHSDDDEGRGDTPISGDMVLECHISELSMQLLADQEGFFAVGNGYTLHKITVEKVKEQTIWEGEFDVTWGTPFKGLQNDLINLVKPGNILRAYVTGEGQGCAATAWWRNLETGYSDDDQGRGDTSINGDMVLECHISELSMQLLADQEGFFMVGNGYTLKKLTVE